MRQVARNDHLPTRSSQARAEMTVADWPAPKISHDKGVATTATRLVPLEDGSRFILKSFAPDRQYWDTSVDFMLPLGTEVEGYNTYFAYQLAKAGIHSRIIGTNKANGHSLAHDAQASLAILREDDDQAGQNAACQPNQSVSFGYSMGSLKAMALTGFASDFNRSVKLTLGVDPGPAHKVNYTPAQAAHFGLWLAQASLDIPKMISDSCHESGVPRTLARSRRLARSVSLRPTALLNTVDKLRTITKGETGQSLAAVPWEAAMVLHFFKNNYYNDRQLYAELLEGRPNVRLVNEPSGSHFRGAFMSSTKALVNKTAHGLDLLDQGVTQAELAEALNYPIIEARH